MRNRRTVLMVMIAFRWDLENCPREIEKIKRALGSYPVKAAMHSKRQIGLVVQTDLNSKMLMDRLRGPLAQGCVERAWCYTIGRDIVATEELDPLTERVHAAWVDIGKWNQPQNLRRPKARDILVKHGIKDADSRAAVKMGIHPRSVRKRP